MTRWLFTSIAIPTNLLAGGSHYRFDRFFIMSLFGEITWMALFYSLGYWFGSERVGHRPGGADCRDLYRGLSRTL